MDLGPLASKQPHFPVRAKRIIFLFMHGGVSHVDTFDPKPRLDKDHGKPVADQALAHLQREVGWWADAFPLGIQAAR